MSGEVGDEAWHVDAVTLQRPKRRGGIAADDLESHTGNLLAHEGKDVGREIMRRVHVRRMLVLPR